MIVTTMPSSRADTLNPTQRLLLSQTVANQAVIDLGGGDGSLALWMIECGAKKVTVVDKERHYMCYHHKRISYAWVYFKDVHNLLNEKSFDVGVISWPANYWEAMVTLVPALIRLPKVIYIGSNRGMAQCGTPELWRYLTRRKLIFAEEGQPSSVIIYGEYGRDLNAQPLVSEEECGLRPKNFE